MHDYKEIVLLLFAHFCVFLKSFKLVNTAFAIKLKSVCAHFFVNDKQKLYKLSLQVTRKIE